MAYSYFANYSKSILHWAVENTFPSTPLIATISAGVGIGAHKWGMTFIQRYQVNFIEAQAGCLSLQETPLRCLASSITSMSIVPDSSPLISYYISIGATCGTSFILNQVAKGIFKISNALNKKSSIIKKENQNTGPSRPIHLDKDQNDPSQLNVDQVSIPTPSKNVLRPQSNESTTEQNPPLKYAKGSNFLKKYCC